MVLNRGPLNDVGRRTARNRLIRDVLGDDAVEHDEMAGPWHAFAYFVPDGRCVANIDAAVLPLIVDGRRRDAGAIRSVAVDPAWRGRGLFRDLMTEALTWCDAKSASLTLLYTEGPDLYLPFGFRNMLQHAFVGGAPKPRTRASARKLRLDRPEDAVLLREAIAERAPVSRQCALLIDADQLMANLAADDDLRIAYDAGNRTAIVYEVDDNLLTIVDVVAPVMPDMATIIGALNLSSRRIRTFFPPDQLGWQGRPVAEDTGLMLRGAVPTAMDRPFMFPPTSEF